MEMKRAAFWKLRRGTGVDDFMDKNIIGGSAWQMTFDAFRRKRPVAPPESTLLIDPTRNLPSCR